MGRRRNPTRVALPLEPTPGDHAPDAPVRLAQRRARDRDAGPSRPRIQVANSPMEQGMRYLPGSIVISDEADVPLLRTVHRAGHVTIQQLYASLYPAREKRLWDTLSWRIGRLVKNEFLDRTPVAGLQGAVLSLGENGELYLQGREQFLVERAGRTRGLNRRHQIWHDVELFDIQLALRRAGVVALWESEAEVKAANDFTTDRYAKDYDAVVTFRSGRRCGQVALEYERTPKWSKQYERICTEMDHEKKL